MNLSKLFETQRKLDERIVKEKGLEGQDLLPMKILALQVELGELANEWRGFKFWSENRHPYKQVSSTTGDRRSFDFFQCFNCNERLPVDAGKEYQGGLYADCPDCEVEMHAMKNRNPMLEEYVDCLHFILSIGLEIKKENSITLTSLVYNTDPYSAINDISETFNHTFKHTWNVHADYQFLFIEFIRLGKSLGFTTEQIEESYYAKNQINHERQSDGY